MTSRNARRLDIDVMHGPAGLLRAAALRREVFIEEQNVPEELEWDDYDAVAQHYLASCEGEIVAVARVIELPEGQRSKVQRVAVRRDLRQSGIGSQLMQRVIGDATRAHRHELVLDAQTHAIAFYRRLGFEVRTPLFLDAGIPHVQMTRITRGTQCKVS